MNIKNIRKQANQIYLKYRQQIIPEFFYVGYVSLLAQYLQSGLFSFFVSLFLCPISHGYVKCAMKLVDEENTHIDYHESMVGILDFARVLPAYLMRKLIILFVTFLVGLPVFLKYYGSAPTWSLGWLSFLGEAFIQTDLFIPDFEMVLAIISQPWLCVVTILSIFCYLFLTALFMPVPYVMELDEFSWNECMQFSVHLMKGKMLDYFKLYIAYLPRHIIYWGLTGLMLMTIGSWNEILMLLCFVISLFVYIGVFKGRFEIAKYLFYKDVRGDYDERHYGD